MTTKGKDGAVQHIRNAVVHRREGGSIFARGISVLAENAVAKSRLGLPDGKATAEMYSERGDLYHKKKDYEEALKWYLLGAELGHARAQVGLGTMFSLGRGVPQDKAESNSWFRLAADQGDARGQWAMGSAHAFAGGLAQDKLEAARWFRLAAEQGGTTHQYRLAEMCEKGRYVPQDDTEAIKWYRLAADQRDARAQYQLGSMCERGRGVPQSYEDAIRLYCLAAEQGNASAQVRLGFMHEVGRGVSQDKLEAVRWYRLAAERDEDELQDEFECADQLYDDDCTTEAYEQIFFWCRPSAEHGNARAQTLLGSMYEFGHAVPSDICEANKWYEAAADQGHADAQVKLGRLLYKQWRASALPKNPSLYERATVLFRQAAEQGNVDGAYELAAKRYKVGNYYGTDQDAEAAAKWYRIAADKGHIRAKEWLEYCAEVFTQFLVEAEAGDSYAQTQVGYRYLIGEGVPKSISEAVKWFRFAADQYEGRAQEALADMYAIGEGVAKNLVVAYALCCLDTNKGAFKSETLASLTPQMNLAEIRAAKVLSESMAKPGNLLTALDEYIGST